MHKTLNSTFSSSTSLDKLQQQAATGGLQPLLYLQNVMCDRLMLSAQSIGSPTVKARLLLSRPT